MQSLQPPLGGLVVVPDRVQLVQPAEELIAKPARRIAVKSSVLLMESYLLTVPRPDDACNAYVLEPPSEFTFGTATFGKIQDPLEAIQSVLV